MTKEGELKEIRNKKLFLVEGRDDEGFFVKLLNHIGVSDFFVWGVRGKNKLNTDMPTLTKLRGFSNLTHLCIIRDHDQDDAFESVINILKQINFSNLPSAPSQVAGDKPKIGIFICPGESIDGSALEDICLEIMKEHPAMKCVNAFASCISQLESSPQNLSKSKILAFLASQPEAVNNIGIAAEKEYWDLESSALKELVDFLSLFK